METIGDRLARLRNESGLTLSQVSSELGVSVSTYRDWEYGTLITGEPYLKLASIYKVSLSYLITGKSAGCILENNYNHVKSIYLKLQDLLENWNYEK